MVQTLFTWLLVGVLVVSVGSFLVMGLAQVRRTNSLARRAHEMQLSFSATDLFDVPSRYRGFSLIVSGHSGRANNVTYGRMGGWPIRAFDYRYEVGHGTRRLTRHYSVVAAETEWNLPPVLLWSRRDLDGAPMELRPGNAGSAEWIPAGDDRLAGLLREGLAEAGDEGDSLQVCGSTLLLCCPVSRRRPSYGTALERMECLLRTLRKQWAQPSSGRSNNVANGRTA